MTKQRDQEEEDHELQRVGFRNLVEDLLSIRLETQYCTVKQLENEMWFYAKEVKGWAYIVITSHDYPEEAAYECVDELSTRNYKFSNKNKQARHLKRNCLCHVTAMKYNDHTVGGVLWQLTKEMDEDVRSEYKKSIRAYIQSRRREERERELKDLEQEVANLKLKLSSAIEESLKKTAKMEDLAAMAEDTFEKAMVFKKKAVELKERTCRKNEKKRIVACSTVAFAAVGGTCTFLAGGPASAVFCTAIGNQIVAQTLETILIGAASASVGYYSSQVATDTYFWAQKFIVV